MDVVLYEYKILINLQVDYLTQDKARLSADIRQYASKISRDFEEKVRLPYSIR